METPFVPLTLDEELDRELAIRAMVDGGPDSVFHLQDEASATSSNQDQLDDMSGGALQSQPFVDPQSELEPSIDLHDYNQFDGQFNNLKGGGLQPQQSPNLAQLQPQNDFLQLGQANGIIPSNVLHQQHFTSFLQLPEQSSYNLFLPSEEDLFFGQGNNGVSQQRFFSWSTQLPEQSSYECLLPNEDNFLPEQGNHGVPQQLPLPDLYLESQYYAPDFPLLGENTLYSGQANTVCNGAPQEQQAFDSSERMSYFTTDFQNNWERFQRFVSGAMRRTRAAEALAAPLEAIDPAHASASVPMPVPVSAPAPAPAPATSSSVKRPAQEVITIDDDTDDEQSLERRRGPKRVRAALKTWYKPGTTTAEASALDDRWLPNRMSQAGMWPEIEERRATDNRVLSERRRLEDEQKLKARKGAAQVVTRDTGKTRPKAKIPAPAAAASRQAKKKGTQQRATTQRSNAGRKKKTAPGEYSFQENLNAATFEAKARQTKAKARAPTPPATRAAPVEASEPDDCFDEDFFRSCMEDGPTAGDDNETRLEPHEDLFGEGQLQPEEQLSSEPLVRLGERGLLPVEDVDVSQMFT